MSIDLYSIGTPNGQKITVALEEMGIPYKEHLVHIGKNDQFKPEFQGSVPTTRSPPSSTTVHLAALCHSSNQAPSCCIWLRRVGSSCRPTCTRNTRSPSGSCGRWEASDRCWARWVTSGNTRPRTSLKRNSPMARSVISPRASGCGRCSTRSWRARSTYAVTSASPTSPSFHGSSASTSSTAWLTNSSSTRTCRHTSSECGPVRRSRKAWPPCPSRTEGASSIISRAMCI
mmetsp:Transcript_38901/g.97285  ORF Transcript_38901/g.97285 Transcript_38901/m.97285 type:complete len:230 (+) Transcript_38901:480-1169(+)